MLHFKRLTHLLVAIGGGFFVLVQPEKSNMLNMGGFDTLEY